MKKIIISILILTAMVIPMISIAEDITYIEAEQVDVHSEQVVMDSDNTTIYTDVVIDIDGFKAIKGTVVRSVNYRNDKIPFKPSEFVANQIANILKTDKYKFGTVALNEFALNGYFNADSYQGRVYKDSKPLSKEEYILGGDIAIREEWYNFDTGVYTYTGVESDYKIDTAEAIMMIYKTLGRVQYTHYFRFYAKGSKAINIGETPFMELVPDVFAAIDPSRYYTDVFTTRTDINFYWQEAINDKIVFTDTEKQAPLTIAEFCYYVFTKMDREREPVLTEEETKMLLLAHGRNLPLYLPSSQLHAVKHLIARGVVESEIDFLNELDVETALKILCRAKYPETRLTFKYVEYPYVESLVDQGYMPIDMKLSEMVFEETSIELLEGAVISHLDYYIERNEHTIFHPSEDRDKIINDIFVSAVWDNISASPYPGTSVEIVENGRYYHVRVPISIVDDKSAFRNNTFTINTIDPSDSPENLKVPYGGGVYKWDNGKLVRSPFTSEFPSSLVDEERKLANMRQFKGAKLGPSDKKVVFRFKLAEGKSIDDILWDGQPITQQSSNLFSGIKDSEGYYSITVEASDPYKYLLRNLSYNSNVTESEMIKAYVADDRAVFVSLKWLRKTGLVTGVVEVTKGKKWILYSDTENTLIDLEKRIIVSGQTITEIADNDRSLFVVADPLTGDMLIDYRAVNNMSSGYVMVKDAQGNLSLSIPETRAYTFTSTVYPLLGEGMQSMKALNGDRSVVNLEATYPVANWIIYKKRVGVENSEYLLVFRPDRKSNAVSEIDMQNFKISMFGIQEVQNVRINAYRIDMSVVYDDDSAKRSKNFIIEDLSSSDFGVYYDINTSSYYYKVPTISNLSQAFADYMNQDVKYPLPIFRYIRSGIESSATLVNLNLNLIGETPLDLATYPKDLLNSSVYTTELKGTGPIFGKTMTLAIAGAQAKYYPYAKKNIAEINRSSSVYLGSMKVTVKTSDSYISYLIYTLQHKNIDLKSIGLSSVESSRDFTEVFRGSRGSIYVYGLGNQFRIVGFDDIVDESSTWNKNYLATGHKDLFNWGEFSISEFLKAIDDGVSLAHLFILSVLPRIMLMLFLAFMVLSLVRDNKIVLWIANNIVDPFKVISFGLTSIENVRTTRAWASVFVASVTLAMFSSGILEIISWIVRFSMEFLKLK